MKTNSTIRQLSLALIMIISVTACKKDKKENPAPPPVEVKAMTITELKALSTGPSVKIPDARKIKGVVVSDVAGKNIDSKTVILQEATDKPAVIITFDAAQTFAANDEVEVTVSNQTLAVVSGEMIVQNVPSANAKKIGTGSITPRTTSVDQIIANAAAWDGTLVSIGKGLFSGSGKYTGTLSYADDKGIIKSMITSGAAFAGTDYPALVNGITGIVRVSGTDIFLNVRNAADVRSSDSFVIVEDFSGATEGLYTSAFYTADGQQLFNNPLQTSASKSGKWYQDWARSTAVGTSSLFLVKNNTGSNDPDASILTTGRNYFYILPYIGETVYNRLLDPNDAFFGQEWNRFAGSLSLGRSSTSPEEGQARFKDLKSITIIFAGSKMTSSNFDLTGGSLLKDVTTNAFDPAKDGVFAYLDLNNSKIDASTVFRTQGQWHTVTFSDINTKIAAIDAEKGYNTNLRLTFGSAVNKRGSFTYYGRAGRETPNNVAGSPIVIDKIIFEFAQKPEWSK